MQEVYRAIIDSIEKNEDTVLVTIIENVCSSPRSSGAKMLVHKDHTIVGTVGGGPLEANAIHNADAVFTRKSGFTKRYLMNGTDAAKSEMICGGYGAILLTYISGSDHPAAEVFRAVADSIENRKKGWLITTYAKDKEHLTQNEYCFISEAGEVTGRNPLPQGKSSDILSAIKHLAIHSEEDDPENLLIEKLQKKKTVYIFGGGHVAKETEMLARYVDFQTVIIDDRVEFANNERFPESEVFVVPSFTELPDLPVDEESFVVILTRGHLGDYDALKAMLDTQAFYIGMIGSLYKRNLIFERLKREGVPQEQIDRVISPIGLKLNGETPEEIAVSIVSQLILERSRLK